MSACGAPWGHRYVQENGIIYYYDGLDYPQRQEVPADSNSFEILSDLYGKDKTYVYFMGKIIEGADLKTFKLFNDGYGEPSFAKDIRYVYQYGEKVEGADPLTIEAAGIDNNMYLKDARSVFVDNEKIEGADPETFQLVSCGIVKDKNSVYWINLKLPDVDSASFKLLNCEQFEDKNGIYQLEALLKKLRGDSKIIN